MALVTVSDWRTSTLSSRVRAALWLHAEVGPGGSFTKQQLRDAFPNIEQIDRRMRDLRAEGWVIATYREDRSLSSSDELRLVREGGAVWERGYQSLKRDAISDKMRQAVFAADNYVCLFCGISGGESYPDDALRTAKLTVARVEATGNGEKQLLTCCDRCHAGQPPQETTAQLLGAVGSMTAEQQDRLGAWVRSGKRAIAPEHLLWARYRRLPAEARDAVAAELRNR